MLEANSIKTFDQQFNVDVSLLVKQYVDTQDNAVRADLQAEIQNLTGANLTKINTLLDTLDTIDFADDDVINVDTLTDAVIAAGNKGNLNEAAITQLQADLAAEITARTNAGNSSAQAVATLQTELNAAKASITTLSDALTALTARVSAAETAIQNWVSNSAVALQAVQEVFFPGGLPAAE